MLSHMLKQNFVAISMSRKMHDKTPFAPIVLATKAVALVQFPNRYNVRVSYLGASARMWVL